MEIWTIDDFKKYTRQSVNKHYWIKPSRVVLNSFYIADVEKPKEITVKMFDWLRKIAEKEIKDYKSTLNIPESYNINIDGE